MLFYPGTDAVIYGQMKLLNYIGFCFGYTDADIGKAFKLTAALTCKTDNL